MQHDQQPTPEREDVPAVAVRHGTRESKELMLERLLEVQDGLSILWDTTELIKQSILEELEDDV
jgi:hypothetical protein